MATWLVFGDVLLGKLEAPDRDAAALEAELRFGWEAQRIQSEASWQIGQLERERLTQRMRRNGHG